MGENSSSPSPPRELKIWKGMWLTDRYYICWGSIEAFKSIPLNWSQITVNVRRPGEVQVLAVQKPSSPPQELGSKCEG